MTLPPVVIDVGRYLRFHRRYGKSIGIAAILLLAETAFALTLLYVPRHVLDRVVPKHDFGVFWLMIACVSAAVVAKEALAAGSRFILITVQNKVSLALIVRMIRTIYRQPMSLLDGMQSGYVRARIMADVKSLDPISAGNLLKNLIEAIFVVVSFTAVFWLDRSVAAVLLCVVGLHTFATLSPYSSIAKRSAENSERWAQANSMVQERMQGLRSTVLFNRQRYEIHKLGRALTTSTDMSVDLSKRLEALNRIVAAVGSLGIFALLGLCVDRYMRGEMTGGEIVIALGYSTYCLNSASNVFVTLIVISSVAGPLRRVLEILDRVDSGERPDTRTIAPVAGGVEFDRVSFSYTGGTPVLKDVSFHLRAGERVAIVGPSGAGKTTLLNLILGLYEPTTGVIRMDGTPLSNISKRHLRQQAGYVSQDVFLFDGSIRENLAYSNVSATEAQITAAARSANLHDFIESLPRGYDTPVGELGRKLSGGQRQRIAVARILLLDPAIVLLDEVTAHQDRINEEVLLDALATMSAGKTVIVITHSPSVLKIVERIIVLDHGRIAAEGTHAELMEAAPLYRKLCAAPRRPIAETNDREETNEREAVLI